MCGVFDETPEISRKLRVSTNFPHEDIFYGILCIVFFQFCELDGKNEFISSYLIRILRSVTIFGKWKPFKFGHLM